MIDFHSMTEDDIEEVVSYAREELRRRKREIKRPVFAVDGIYYKDLREALEELRYCPSCGTDLDELEEGSMTQLSQPRIVEKARAYAIAAHTAVGQKRKYTGEPYHVHCQAVAEMVTSIGGDDNMIAAAWLHDTVEDTAITLGDIRREFGDDVAGLVDWLTDSQTPEDGNRATRKAREVYRLGMAPDRVQTIKLADLIDNTSSIVTYDPKFARVYLREKQAILRVMTDGTQALRCQAIGYLRHGMKQLGMDDNE